MFQNCCMKKRDYDLFDKVSSSVNITYAVVEDQNLEMKKTMEDFTISEINLIGNSQFDLFVILDGHGGSEIASFYKKNSLRINKIRRKQTRGTNFCRNWTKFR